MLGVHVNSPNLMLVDCAKVGKAYTGEAMAFMPEIGKKGSFLFVGAPGCHNMFWWLRRMLQAERGWDTFKVVGRWLVHLLSRLLPFATISSSFFFSSPVVALLLFAAKLTAVAAKLTAPRLSTRVRPPQDQRSRARPTADQGLAWQDGLDDPR
jgi:hypothetical protein